MGRSRFEAVVEAEFQHKKLHHFPEFRRNIGNLVKYFTVV
jgi:hypothetical protein